MHLTRTPTSRPPFRILEGLWRNPSAAQRGVLCHRPPILGPPASGAWPRGTSFPQLPSAVTSSAHHPLESPSLILGAYNLRVLVAYNFRVVGFLAAYGFWFLNNCEPW
jgi:hypothetical protein